MSDIPVYLPLGKNVPYPDVYNPELLCPIERSLQRKEIGLSLPLPFTGVDVWFGFELSWLRPSGVPEVAQIKWTLPHDSKYLIESKSMKLYLCSLNQKTFSSPEEVAATIERDLSAAVCAPVKVELYLSDRWGECRPAAVVGACLDDLDVKVDRYTPDPSLLRQGKGYVENETVYTNLFKSNCLVTGQPDWACIQISYSGRKISRESLLAYLISFRKHVGFHEDVVELIFSHLAGLGLEDVAVLGLEKVTVYGQFLRRGGLCINPFRSMNRSLEQFVLADRQ